ncbi:MAG TPA: carboxypeptidase-like regulatory domain-containing protein, partial [Thermoanaerobaculia bacterium]|nr:carboxypeptidase-like regulatory domain-containing protein [Thermoanaerobaculia bacterium]
MKSSARNSALVSIFLVASALPATAGELRGRVLSGEKPVAGATVAAVPYETPLEEARRLARGGAAPARLASAVTAADGTFVVALAADVKTPDAPEALVALEVSGAGVAAMRLEDVFSAVESEDAGDVAVPRGDPLAGRVVDGSGAPVAEAEVLLLARGEDDLRPVPVSAKTGADGAFRFEAAAPGSRVIVRKPGFAALELSRVSPGILTRPVVLSPGLALAGVVKKPDGKTPASGALLRFEGSAPSRWVEAGEDGGFRIADLPRGKGRLIADGGEAGSREVPVVTTAEAPVAIVLAPAAALAGRVVDAKSGRPVPRAKLTLSSGSGSLVTRSKPDGRYAFRPLPTGAFALKADEARHVPWSAAEISVAAGAEKKLDVPLTLGATLSGRVVDEAGQPVAGARGSLSREGGTGLAALMRAARGDEPSTFRSGADGGFKAARLSPGNNQRLLFRHPEHERAQLGGISLAPGGVKANIVVVMKKGGVVTGRVLDETNQPVAAADVELSAPMGERRGRGGMVAMIAGPGGRRGGARSGVDGAFEIRGVLPGDHALSVSKGGYATAHVDVVKVKEGEPTAPVSVRLAKGAAIRGVVRRPDGTGAEGYIVTTGLGRGFGGMRGRPPQPTGTDGAFEIAGLKDGESYDLAVVSGTGLGPQKRGVVAPAENVEVVVGGAGRIRGRALDGASSRPVADYSVTYEPETGGGGAGRMIRFASRAAGGSLAGGGEKVDVHAEDGAFTLEDVPAGTWRVVFAAPGYQTGYVGSVAV